MPPIDENKRLAALRDLAVLDTPPEAIFDSLTRLAALTFKAPIALISLVDADRQWFKSCVGLAARETPREIAFCDHAIRQAEPMVVADAAADPRFRDNPLVTGPPGIRFYAGAPLITPDGDRLGTLCVIDTIARGDFGPDRQAELKAMACSASEALVMRRDISGFLALEREQASKNQLLSQAEALAGLGHWSWDVRTDRCAWSDAVYRIHGYDPATSPPDLSGVLGLYLPEDAAALAQMVDRAVRFGEPYTLHARIRRPDGEIRHVAAQGAAQINERGEVARLLGTFLDITDLKLADEKLRENEERFQFLTKHMSDVIVRTDTWGRILWISPSCRHYGYQVEELIGRTPAELYHPDDAAKIAEYAQAMNLGAAPDPDRPFECRLRAKDGRWAWTEHNPTLIRAPDGAPVEVVSMMRDIGARKAMEAQIASSEARYRLLANNASDVISCQTGDGIFVYLSPSVSAVAGYEPAELLGKPSADFIHPDDLQRVRDLYDAYLASDPHGRSFRFEYRAIHKDGHAVWLESESRAIFDQATGALVEYQDVARDITARKATESALAVSEARHNVIGDHVSDIITRSDINGRLLYASPSLTAVTGYTFDDIAQSQPGFMNAIHPDDAEATLLHVERIAHGAPAQDSRARYRYRHKDGHWIWMECSPTLVRDAQGKAKEVVDVIRDVTAQLQLEESLAKARDAAEAAAAVKSEFMANMSHEIRTPLTAILGFTALLSDRTDLAPGARTQIERIAGAGRALLSIVNDVLDFSKLEAGQVEIKPRACEPVGLLRDALLMFSTQAEAKGLALNLVLDGDLPPAVRIDPDRVRQVLLNLIGNAIKFTERGSVRLAAGYDEVAQRLTIRIEDTGPGLSAAQQTVLFKRFSQVNAASTRNHGGTGLGLVICKGLVEAMGGAIGVLSQPGRGSSFHFEIAAPRTEAPLQRPVEGSAGGALDFIRVLVVDDNAVNRELARAILEQLGAEVTEAWDGASGVEAASTLPVDVILMDIRMPGMSGPEALAVIRGRKGPNQATPILAFTADLDLERLGEAHRFDGLVRKPIAPIDLALAIHKAAGTDEFEPAPRMAGE